MFLGHGKPQWTDAVSQFEALQTACFSNLEPFCGA